MSENRNAGSEQNQDERYVRTLQKLQDAAQKQNKTEYVEALDAAIKALKDSLEKGDEQGDDMRLSTPSEHLLKLAADVKANGTSPQQRSNAAAHLARLAGKR